jgi:hypothetical protein
VVQAMAAKHPAGRDLSPLFKEFLQEPNEFTQRLPRPFSAWYF